MIQRSTEIQSKQNRSQVVPQLSELTLPQEGLWENSAVVEWDLPTHLSQRHFLACNLLTAR
jgi:hypothetical protein